MFSVRVPNESLIDDLRQMRQKEQQNGVRFGQHEEQTSDIVLLVSSLALLGKKEQIKQA